MTKATIKKGLSTKERNYLKSLFSSELELYLEEAISGMRNAIAGKSFALYNSEGDEHIYKPTPKERKLISFVINDLIHAKDELRRYEDNLESAAKKFFGLPKKADIAEYIFKHYNCKE